MDSERAIRGGRAAARHLRSLCETKALTLSDARRLLDKIEAALDATLGEAPAPVAEVLDFAETRARMRRQLAESLPPGVQRARYLDPPEGRP